MHDCTFSAEGMKVKKGLLLSIGRMNPCVRLDTFFQSRGKLFATLFRNHC